MPDLAELTKTQTGPNVIAAQRVIWNGEPGTRWTNDTGVVKYQLICRLRNTCGFCLQYHLAIGARWGIILHHGCRCKQVPIQPDAEAPHPFVDFRELLDNLPHHEQVAAIGAGNYRLLKEGLADWSDIVTPTRVRDLREVVAIKKLSLQELLDAKIKPQFAEEAHNAVHTPEHELVERHRRELMEKVKQAGLSQDQLVRQLALRMSERVTVAAGPIATGTTEEAWAASRIGTLPHAAELGLIMRHWPKPPPAGPAAPPAGPGPPAASSSKSFKRFTSEHEAQRWGAEHYGRWGEEVPQEQVEAISDYLGVFYRTINDYFRLDEDFLSERNRARVALLDKATHAVVTPEPIVVTRWSDPRDMGFKAGFKPGMEIIDKGYISTSLDPEYEHIRGDQRFEIRLPKGTPAAYIPAAIPRTQGESELLLARDVDHFQVIEIRDDKYHTVVLEAKDTWSSKPPPT